MPYQVIQENCIYCGICVDGCPTQAIHKEGIYYVEPDLCTDCGACANRALVDCFAVMSYAEAKNERDRILSSFGADKADSSQNPQNPSEKNDSKEPTQDSIQDDKMDTNTLLKDLSDCLLPPPPDRITKLHKGFTKARFSSKVFSHNQITRAFLNVYFFIH